MRSLSHVSRAAAAALAGLGACLLWLRHPVHVGAYHQFATLTHHRVHASQGALLFVLWLTFAALVAIILPAARVAGRRLPLPDPGWAAWRPLTLEDRLAAATFAVFGANRSARRLPEGGIVFRALGPCVVALGGPAGAPGAAHRAQSAFRRWAGHRPVIWYGTGSGGRSALRFGQEAIIRLARHDLASPRLANVRHSVARARRAGIELVDGPWSSLPEAARRQVETLERRARRRPRLRLTLSSVADARDGRRWSLAVRNGRVEAAITWLDAAGMPGTVLDVLLRRPDAVPGSVELLIEAELARAAERGVEWASLGVCGSPGLPAWLQALNPPGLRRFKEKFAPEWHDRYIVAPGLPLPLALLAVAAAHLVP